MKDNEIKNLLNQDKSEPSESRQTWSNVYSEISRESSQKQSWLNRLRIYTLPSIGVLALVIFLYIEKKQPSELSELSIQEIEAIAEYLFEDVGFAEEEEFLLNDEIPS